MESITSNKRIAKNSIILFTRLVFSTIVGLITSRVILQSLGIENFGLYNLVGGFVVLLSIFTFSISSTCQRFISIECGIKNNNKLDETFSTFLILLKKFAFLFFICFGIIGTIIIINFFNIPKGRITAAIIVYFCSLFVFCMQMVVIPYTSLINAHERMGFYAVISIGESIGKLIIAYAICFAPWDKLIIYAALLCILSCIVRFLYIIYCKREFPTANTHSIFNKTIFRQILHFSLWMSCGSFLGMIKDYGGSVILNLFFGLTLNATNGISMQVKNTITSLANNMGLAISPQITKAYSSGQHNDAIRLTFMLVKFQGTLILFLILPLLIETPYILNLWLGQIPPFAVSYVRLTIILCYISILSQGHGPLLLAKGEIKKLQLILSPILALIIPISYILFYFDFPPTAYLYICIISESIMLIICYYYLKIIMNFPFYTFLKNVLLKIILCVAISTSIIMLIKQYNDEETWWSFLYIILTCWSILAFLTIFVIFDKNERKILYSYIHSTFLQKRK